MPLGYFINAAYELSVHIALLLSALLVNGFVPHEMSESTVISISIGKNANLSTLANCRGITLGSMFGQICDIIVLRRFSE